MNIHAYLEDFRCIKLIVKDALEVKELCLTDSNHQIISHSVQYQETHCHETHFYLTTTCDLMPYRDYHICINTTICIFVELGRIARSAQFDEMFYFEDWLGFQYTKEKTTFRLWTPVAKVVNLILEDEAYSMTYTKQGVWEVTVEKDVEKCKYWYQFRINQAFLTTIDPYGISSTSNHQWNYVIDWDKTYAMQSGYYQLPHFQYTDAIIYELNVRDATSKVKSLPIAKRGTYRGLTESIDQSYGLGYIQSLGVTHIQLMPIFAFAGVDEEVQDVNHSSFRYNWGYNPMQYLVPSGFFSECPGDPYARINELKQCIDTIHSIGLGVNMDVVFNHVFDAKCFPMEQLVPGYTFRTDDRGYLTNSSWCGNDCHTNHLMVRKLICDAIHHFQVHYQIDGFRFDLMGLMDIQTMDTIEQQVKKQNPLAMLYGEGWTMDVNLPQNQRANLENAHSLPHIAFFNDRFRNEIKYFSTGNRLDSLELLQLFQGCITYQGKLVAPSQSINYVECHDNATYFDYCIKQNITKERVIDYVRLVLGIVVLSSGIPFLHAGEELLRTKKGVENTYQSTDDINGIDWCTENTAYRSLIDLIAIRKKYDVFRYHQKEDVENNIKLEKSDGLISIRLSSSYTTIQVVISNQYEVSTKYFSPGTYLIYDGQSRCYQEVDKIRVCKPGIYVFEKR
ncbi:MAG: type I pullulanase [Prevotella sp.]|nr:type I pullulanase [Staphylococcus sp.]MCM1349827.1 type I pullulanase [Prevotella sp.]